MHLQNDSRWTTIPSSCDCLAFSPAQVYKYVNEQIIIIMAIISPLFVSDVSVFLYE